MELWKGHLKEVEGITEESSVFFMQEKSLLLHQLYVMEWTCQLTGQVVFFSTGQFGNGVLSFFLFLKWLLFLDILIFIIQFSFISVPKLTLPEPPNNSCPTVSDNSTEKNIGNLIVDFMTGQVS